MHLSTEVTVCPMLTVRSQTQGWHQHQRVRNAVRGQQQRQLVQDESAQILICTVRRPPVGLYRRGEVFPMLSRGWRCLFHRRKRGSWFLVSRCGRHNVGEQPKAFIQTHGTGLHLRQTQDELEEKSWNINTLPCKSCYVHCQLKPLNFNPQQLFLSQILKELSTSWKEKHCSYQFLYINNGSKDYG